MGWFSNSVKAIGDAIVGGARATGRGLAGLTAAGTAPSLRGARAAIAARNAENLVKGVGGAGVFVGASILAFFGVKTATSWLEAGANIPKASEDFFRGVGWLAIAGGVAAIGTGVYLAIRKR